MLYTKHSFTNPKLKQKKQDSERVQDGAHQWKASKTIIFFFFKDF